MLLWHHDCYAKMDIMAAILKLPNVWCAKE